MNRITTIWQQLENEPPVKSGLLKIRYSQESTSEVYLGLLTPNYQRCLLLKISTKAARHFQTGKNLKSLKIEKVSDPHQTDFSFLNLILLNKKADEIFDVLIQDIINSISLLSGEKEILNGFISRLESWRMLFDRPESEGLSPEAQLGLFGELFFLRKWAVKKPGNIAQCTKAWLGPDKELRDFQMSDWAIEVKTTDSNNHQKIHISSERQLDITNLEVLFLFHLSLETQQENGETLNQAVDSIIELLISDIATQTQFRSKLLQVGYFIQHRPLYEDKGYQVRQESFYTVRSGFPRIEERDIRKGVGDVKYSIILSDYHEYIITESSVFKIVDRYE